LPSCETTWDEWPPDSANERATPTYSARPPVEQPSDLSAPPTSRRPLKRRRPSAPAPVRTPVRKPRTPTQPTNSTAIHAPRRALTHERDPHTTPSNGSQRTIIHSDRCCQSGISNRHDENVAPTTKKTRSRHACDAKSDRTCVNQPRTPRSRHAAIQAVRPPRTGPGSPARREIAPRLAAGTAPKIRSPRQPALPADADKHRRERRRRANHAARRAQHAPRPRGAIDHKNDARQRAPEARATSSFQTQPVGNE